MKIIELKHLDSDFIDLVKRTKEVQEIKTNASAVKYLISVEYKKKTERVKVLSKSISELRYQMEQISNEKDEEISNLKTKLVRANNLLDDFKEFFLLQNRLSDIVNEKR